MANQQRKPAKPVRARDISAPEKHITIGGKQYVLRFSNTAIRIAEDVYAERYGRDVGFTVILRDLSNSKYKAVMALYYGALCAGGADVSWDAFDRDFRVTSVEGMTEIIQRAMTQMLPEPEATSSPT